jgi:KipI family sensor histidine kinase inhibitor
MELRRVGERAVLVECADLEHVSATYAALRGRRAELGITDLVPAARTVLLDGVADVGEVVAALADLADHPSAPGASASAPERVVELPVTYDGPDLAEVARQWDVDEAEVARIHGAAEFVVAFCGFAPGFAYCTGLPDGLSVRRRAEPRSRVPVGSVALAGDFTSVYPSASPGGWQLIGSTPTRVWRPESDSPALLEPGTRVRFRDASA